MIHTQILGDEWLGKIAGDTAAFDASLPATTLDADHREDDDVTH
jgi:hypothetical protein